MIRIGHGYDVHRLVENRKLILGGVHIEHEKGLMGHSDADVLLHAIIDSLLGAASMGDIGNIFPDNNNIYKNISSLILLEDVVKLLSNKYKISNIDCTIIAQEPKLKLFINDMKTKISQTCNIDIDCINIKATTEEGLGFTGNKEGIAAHSVCLIEYKKNPL